MLEPSIFRSDCPVFMPSELSNIVELMLDTNILFYAKEGDQYNLFDKFSVNGGTPIIKHFGSWVKSKGLQLEKGMNIWERRTDLMGATFVNTLQQNGHWANLTYNENGTIIGSTGWFQEMLFYVIGTLNLTVETRSDIIVLDNIPTRVACDVLMINKLTDVCSQGVAIFSSSDLTFPIAINRQAEQ